EWHRDEHPTGDDPSHPGLQLRDAPIGRSSEDQVREDRLDPPEKVGHTGDVRDDVVTVQPKKRQELVCDLEVLDDDQYQKGLEGWSSRSRKLWATPCNKKTHTSSATSASRTAITTGGKNSGLKRPATTRTAPAGTTAVLNLRASMGSNRLSGGPLLPSRVATPSGTSLESIRKATLSTLTLRFCS